MIRGDENSGSFNLSQALFFLGVTFLFDCYLCLWFCCGVPFNPFVCTLELLCNFSYVFFSWGYVFRLLLKSSRNRTRHKSKFLGDTILL